MTNSLYKTCLQGTMMGCKDGAVVRALASHQCSIPARCHKWVEFVVGSLLTPRVFFRVLRFLSSTKTNISKFQFDQDRGPAEKPTKADVASSLNIVTYDSLQARLIEGIVSGAFGNVLVRRFQF